MSSPLMTRPSYTTRALSNPSSNALSKLPTAQVHSLRESFQILDRDDDGQVNKDDISDMLSQLGLPVTPAELNAFFPPGGPQTMSMPTFLTQISTLLAAMSQPTELLNAFAAFDDGDSGQVDLTELRDALLNTAPEAGERTLSPSEVDRIIGGFSGRRAFGKSMMGAGKRGEVFKYQEFVASVGGGNERKEEQE
jgi:Ca2+-binding EF-hand superfamily protein